MSKTITFIACIWEYHPSQEYNLVDTLLFLIQALHPPFLLDSPVLPHYPSHFLETCQINLGFWETAHLPLFKPMLTLTTHLGQNVGLGEG